jgi:hypothetical protein
MGTQQLLLIVLGVIIVGIAVVVGIQIFGTQMDVASKDAILNDCLRLAADAQGYYNKTTMQGGGGRAFDGLTLAAIGWQADNENGTYSIVSATGAALQIKGASKTDATKYWTIDVDMSQTDPKLQIVPTATGW